LSWEGSRITDERPSDPADDDARHDQDHRLDGLLPETRDSILAMPADLRDLVADYDCAELGCDRYDYPPDRE
jgi:hypothetical protein